MLLGNDLLKSKLDEKLASGSRLSFFLSVVDVVCSKSKRVSALMDIDFLNFIFRDELEWVSLVFKFNNRHWMISGICFAD